MSDCDIVICENNGVPNWTSASNLGTPYFCFPQARTAAPAREISSPIRDKSLASIEADNFIFITIPLTISCTIRFIIPLQNLIIQYNHIT